MKIRELTLSSVRAFPGPATFRFSKGINLLIGPNNCGKSTVLWALKLLQGDAGRPNAPRLQQAVRIGSNQASISILFDRPSDIFAKVFNVKNQPGCSGLEIGFTRTQGLSHKLLSKDGKFIEDRGSLGAVFQATEPDNLYYLFLNGRKPVHYQGNVGRLAESAVRDSYVFLPAKIDRLSSLGNPKAHQYQEQFRAVFSTAICAAGGAAENQKVAGVYTKDGSDFIEIEDMGTGVAQVSAILADMVVARDKIFLIEELENDLHPTALIQVLDALKESAKHNQFIISTHSHIVLSRLCGEPEAKIYKFTIDPNHSIPTTDVAELPNTASARQEILSELGYELCDFGHWGGFLVLEEASAELLIRDFLIPQYAPSLMGRLRTVESKGFERISLTYDALHAVYLYLHLSPIYSARSWVRLDGGEPEARMVQLLKEKFKSDDDFKFRTWQKPAFEHYYPERFSDEIKRVLEMPHGLEKQKAKWELCRKVLVWAYANIDEAKKAFAQTAAEVISDLKEIETRFQK